MVKKKSREKGTTEPGFELERSAVRITKHARWPLGHGARSAARQISSYLY